MASGQVLSTASCRFFLTFVFYVQVLIRFQGQCQTINVALNKTVNMVSTTNYRFLWEGSFAVDGDLRTTPSTCDCCSSTDRSTGPIWFTLDLWEQYSINSIVIMGRSDGNNGLLRQLKVYIRNTTDWTGDPDYNHGTDTSQVINYTLPEAKTAQYVTLVQERYDFIIICEIQVYKQDCILGFYGNTCTPCPVSCLTDTCSQTNGTCLDGCKVGKYGSHCSTNCPPHCKDNVCDQVSGFCTDDCSEGKYGNTCSSDCPGSCRNALCEQNSGDCTNGCVVGRYGDRCDFPCPDSCEDTVCDQKTGDCGNGCVAGKFGASCAIACPAHCKHSLCHQQLGICTNGCEAGFRNQNCTEECDDGKHGLNCSFDCGNCAANPCSKVDGSCPGGCSEGWTGLLCATTEEVQTGSPVAVAAGGVAGAMVVVAVVIIIIVVIRKRRHASSKEDRDRKLETTQQNDNSDGHDQHVRQNDGNVDYNNMELTVNPENSGDIINLYEELNVDHVNESPYAQIENNTGPSSSTDISTTDITADTDKLDSLRKKLAELRLERTAFERELERRQIEEEIKREEQNLAVIKRKLVLK